MIRLATKEDIPAMVQLGIAYHTMLYVPIEAKPIHVAQTMEQNIQNTIVAELGGKIVGFFIAAIVPDIWNADEKIGIELCYFASNTSRRSGTGLAMLKAIQDHLKASGVRFFVANVAEGVESYRANKLYVGKGFSKMQTSYIKEL